MFPIVHYLKGILKNLFNSRISIFAIVSVNVKVDKTAYIYRGVKAKHATIGAHSYVAANTEIENAVIGKYCSIADHCRIGMSGHSLSCLSTSPIFTQRVNALQEKWTHRDVFKHKTKEKTVYIGNDVWIGSHVLVNGGVHIGNGACIGAGAVVVKDVPPRWWRSCKDNPLSFLRGHYYKVTGITMVGYAGGETEGEYQLVPKGKVDYRRTYSVT